MNTHDDFDDLDRALFALPLEEPPAGLRRSILRGTIGARAAFAPQFSQWEIIGGGILVALAVWVSLLCFDKSYATTVTLGVLNLARALSQPATLEWLTVGFGIAALLSLSGGTRLHLPIRTGRSAR